jgi:hypothetical protein
MTPRTPPAAALPVRDWLEADFGDAEFTVREFPDGMFVVQIDAGNRLLVNADQMQVLVGGFMALGREKGWT